MNGIVCYRSGKYHPLEDGRSVKENKVSFILLEVHSCLYGTAYVKMNPKTYNKIKDMQNIKFRYSFLDGPLMDGDLNPWIHHTYSYDTADKLFAKMLEILISENVLNDSFWVHECNYLYVFENLRIRYDKENIRYKYNGVTKFYKDIDYMVQEGETFPPLITFNKKKYKMRKEQEPGTKFSLMRYTENIYFKVRKKFINKIDKVDIRCDMRVYETSAPENPDAPFEEIWEEEHRYEYKWNFKKDQTLSNLIIPRFFPDVIEKLESSNETFYYKIINKITKLNGTKTKKKDLIEFIHKYIPAIPGLEE